MCIQGFLPLPSLWARVTYFETPQEAGQALAARYADNQEATNQAGKVAERAERMMHN